MTYSVWSHARKRYNYYEASGLAAHTPVPDHLRSLGGADVGVAASTAGWPLPAGARLIGYGLEPRGSLASDGDGSLGWVGKVAVAAGLGYLAWRWARGR